ncbi:MAG TPA: sugar ABC transporter permease [Chitinispirillaceae bacterium]|nr:sugar ABC transporter permease [Chitinispirillaceae bacterium]
MNTLQNNFFQSEVATSLGNWIRKTWPLLPATFYLFGFLVIVFLYLATLSLSNPSVGQTFPSLQIFSELAADHDFKEALVNSFLFTIVGTPLELVTGLVCALMLYRKFFMRGFVRSIFLIPLAIPAIVTAMLIYILFDFPGGHVNHLLLGSYPSFPKVIDSPINWRGSGFFAFGISMLGKVWRDLPITMLILLSGLNTIDPELFDVAKTMGATMRTRMVKVVIPLILPSISAVVLLRSVEMWKEFIFPFVLAGRYRLLGTLIDFFYNDVGNAHKAAAVALVLVTCILISSFILFVMMDCIQKIINRR